MIKNAKKIAKVLCLVVALLMLGMLVMQFLPFWSTDGDAASINGYVWIPKEHKELTKFFKDFFTTQFGIKFSMNYIYLMPVIVFICCVLGISLCLIKPGNFLTFLLPIIGGFYGARGYLLNIVFHEGQNWQLHLALCIVTAAVAAIGLIFSVIPFFKKK